MQSELRKWSTSPLTAVMEPPGMCLSSCPGNAPRDLRHFAHRLRMAELRLRRRAAKRDINHHDHVDDIRLAGAVYISRSVQ